MVTSRPKPAVDVLGLAYSNSHTALTLVTLARLNRCKQSLPPSISQIASSFQCTHWEVCNWNCFKLEHLGMCLVTVTINIAFLRNTHGESRIKIFSSSVWVGFWRSAHFTEDIQLFDSVCSCCWPRSCTHLTTQQWYSHLRTFTLVQSVERLFSQNYLDETVCFDQRQALRIAAEVASGMVGVPIYSLVARLSSSCSCSAYHEWNAASVTCLCMG